MSVQTDAVRSVQFRQEDNFEVLEQTIMQLQQNAEESINEVLHGKGADVIIEDIRPRIHSSKRKWKGKKTSAKLVKSLVLDKKKSDNLTTVIHSKSGYGYLYFPDDGQTTEKHAGEQHFMLKGAENKAGTVLQMCVDNILKNANM